jgi:ParB-like chromosome segregation protein Spo0J
MCLVPAQDLPQTILQALDHPPITIRINPKRTRDQAVHETDDEIDELEEEFTVPPVKKARRTRKKALAPPDAQIENVQPPHEPTPTRSLSPLSPSPRNTRAKSTKAATKARRGRSRN